MCNIQRENILKRPILSSLILPANHPALLEQNTQFAQEYQMPTLYQLILLITLVMLALL